jgi:hypothetical protein
MMDGAGAAQVARITKGTQAMSLKPKKHMVLTTFMLPAGYHKDSWRMECSRSEELANLEFVADLTVMAEKATSIP